MNNFIFSPNQKSAESEDLVEYYTVSGEQDFFDDQQMPRLKKDCDKVCAKKSIKNNGKTKYLVKLSLNSKLYNPLSKYGLEQSRSFLDNTVRPANKFKTVNHKTFNLYLDFLKTKNNSYLLNAERESE